MTNLETIPPVIYTGEPNFANDPILTFESIVKTCLANTNQKFLNLPGYPTDIYRKSTYTELKNHIAETAIKKFDHYGFRALASSRVDQLAKADHHASLIRSKWYGPFFASNYFSIATINDHGEFEGLWLIVYSREKINFRENKRTTTVGINENFYE